MSFSYIDAKKYAIVFSSALRLGWCSIIAFCFVILSTMANSIVFTKITSTGVSGWS